MSLRGRLVASFAYILILAVAALAVPLALNIERRAVSDADARLGGQAQVIASSISGQVARGRAGEALREAIDDFGDELEAGVVVVGDDGALLAAAGSPPSPRGDVPPELGSALAGERVRTERGGTLFVAVPVVDRGAIVGAVRLAQDTDELLGGVRRSWLALAAVGGVVVLAGMGVAWALSSSLARPLRQLSDTAERLGSGRLDARASEEGPAEARAVARAMNRMADDLSGTIESQRDFIANASHQLRTPLTGLRIRLESIAAGGGPDASSAESALREVDRLSDLVEDLLLLARATEPATTGAPVDLADVARDSLERWTPRAAERGHSMVVSAGVPAVAWADVEEVRRALDNLIENAISYCPEGTTIEVAAADGASGSVLSVADDGPGIPIEERTRVFERFFRGGTGRRAGPGTGLGLAIVKEIAERWGASVEMTSNSAGTTVSIRWPPLPSLNPGVDGA